MMPMLLGIGFLPNHMRRSDESEALDASWVGDQPAQGWHLGAFCSAICAVLSDAISRRGL